MIGWMACVRWRKAWKFSTVELCSILRRAALSRARCRRWCRREKYKQMRRKTLLYAFEKRMKACQSAWRRRKYKPTLSYASQMRIKAFCGVSVYTFHAAISARQRARDSVARRKMLQSSTVLNFHALRQRTQAIQPIIYRCHEMSLQRIDLAITSESSQLTLLLWIASSPDSCLSHRRYLTGWRC